MGVLEVERAETLPEFDETAFLSDATLPVLDTISAEQVVTAAMAEEWEELDELYPEFSQSPANVELARKWLIDGDDRIKRLGLSVLQHSNSDLEDVEITELDSMLGRDFIYYGHAAITLARKGVR